MPASPINQTAAAVFEALEKKKRAASTASQWGFYLMFFAMTTSDILRAPSGALRPHADGLGTGYTSFNYGGMGGASERLMARATLADEFSSARVGADDDNDDADDGDVDHKAAAAASRSASGDDRNDEQDLTDRAAGDSTEYDADSASFDDAAIEIEDDDADTFASSGGVAAAAAAGPSSAIASSASAAKPEESLLISLSIHALETVLEFLPVRDVNRVRGMTFGFEAAAARVCPRPLGPGITFVRCSHLKDLPKPAANPHAPPVPFEWRCAHCFQCSPHHEMCVHCGMSIRQSGCRVFLGQVRKQHAAVALSFLIRAVCPEVDILHIESHSNKDGYEKGAAWVYVDTPEQALTVTGLHKRVLFDCDGDGNEGFWLLEDARLEAQFTNFAAVRKADASRKERPLPGQPLVAEFPMTSMLRGKAPEPLHRVAAASHHHHHHHHHHQAAAPAGTRLVPNGDKGWYHHAPYAAARPM
jgi:hypothetical protein